MTAVTDVMARPTSREVIRARPAGFGPLAGKLPERYVFGQSIRLRGLRHESGRCLMISATYDGATLVQRIWPCSGAAVADPTAAVKRRRWPAGLAQLRTQTSTAPPGRRPDARRKPRARRSLGPSLLRHVGGNSSDRDAV
jgi:hypothetical protein